MKTQPKFPMRRPDMKRSNRRRAQATSRRAQRRMKASL